MANNPQPSAVVEFAFQSLLLRLVLSLATRKQAAYNHHGDMSFVIAAQNGVRAHHWKFGNMPAVKGVTQADVLNIVAYVRALQRENGIN